MSDEPKRQRPPRIIIDPSALPPEQPSPIVAAQLPLLELLYGLQEHLAETIIKLDGGEHAAVRIALDAAVHMLDKVDFSPLAEFPFEEDQA